jgi:hypothetical protein
MRFSGWRDKGRGNRRGFRGGGAAGRNSWGFRDAGVAGGGVMAAIFAAEGSREEQPA